MFINIRGLWVGTPACFSMPVLLILVYQRSPSQTQVQMAFCGATLIGRNGGLTPTGQRGVGVPRVFRFSSRRQATREVWAVPGSSPDLWMSSRLHVGKPGDAEILVEELTNTTFPHGHKGTHPWLWIPRYFTALLMDATSPREHWPRSFPSLTFAYRHLHATRAHFVRKGWIGIPEVEHTEHDMVHNDSADFALSAMSSSHYLSPCLSLNLLVFS